MQSYMGAPQLFLTSPGAERRGGCASARAQQAARANGSTALPDQPMSYDCCNVASIILGSFMVFCGFVGCFIFTFMVLISESVPSRFQPVVAVPAAVLVAGIITIVVAVCSANRKAMRLKRNSHVAPHQEQSALAQSFKATTNTGSAPCRSCEHNSGSDNVSSTWSPEPTSISTRTVFGNRAMGCASTIYLMQCSDNVPPSYEAVMQSSIHRATYI